jgi:hypothetical protein
MSVMAGKRTEAEAFWPMESLAEVTMVFEAAGGKHRLERTSKAEEAILLASEPRDVRDYLAKRASSAGLFDRISKETEAELLSRGNRLIDLSLAEYCLHQETARALFDRNADDWPIRALVLSNTALAKGSFRGFPECLFGSEDDVLKYLKTSSADEQAMLFRNPSLDDSFLESFLSLGKPWEAVKQEQRLWALDHLALNEKLQHNRSTADHDDGFNWYMAGKPFEAAWALIEKLEPSAEAAAHLSRLLRDLPADTYKTEGINEALKRWQGTPSDIAGEGAENAKARLSPFQQVRQAGARLLAGKHNAVPGHFLASDDVAIRCGAYEGERKLTADQIKSAIERDADLARVHLMRNEALWRSEKMRDLLVDELLRGAESDEPRWEYQRRDAHYRKEFPAWFERDGDGYAEPDERPISESSIGALVTSVVADPAIKSLQARLAALEKTQQTMLWMLGATLVLLIVGAWR